MKFKSRQREFQELFRALLASKYFRDRNAVCGELLQYRNRQVSAVYQVRVGFRNGEGLYWIKVSPMAQLEYRFLRSVYERFRGVPRLAVVKPVAYLEDCTALIIGHAEGKLLSYRIKRRQNRMAGVLWQDERLKEDCYMCGKWLALLHSYHLLENEQYDVQVLIQYIELRLKKLIDKSILEKEFCDRVMRYLFQNLSRLSPNDLVRVKTHGDYAPYNVLVSGNELVVFDPSVGGYFGRLGNFCARHEDIVHFHNFLMDMSPQIVGSQTRRTLAAAFFEGYNDNSDWAVDESSPVFKAFLVKYKLLDAMNNWPSIIHRLIGEKHHGKQFQRWFGKTCGY